MRGRSIQQFTRCQYIPAKTIRLLGRSSILAKDAEYEARLPCEMFLQSRRSNRSVEGVFRAARSRVAQNDELCCLQVRAGILHLPKASTFIRSRDRSFFGEISIFLMWYGKIFHISITSRSFGLRFSGERSSNSWSRWTSETGTD